jgi:phosphatidylethanolamine-binding protein (PEBP) family uncharacterized protein
MGNHNCLLRILAVTSVLVASATSASALSAKFSWKGINACSGPSPAFQISGAPKGTVSLRFAMRDYHAPNYNHGGSTVPFSGKGGVAQGAISYRPPCPPGGETHLYIWTIDALDQSGNKLATTEARGTFPAK